ncbi:YqjF family protein [Streptomyces sp. NPDC102451]|uniref:YqjF family protein n=1 Tax=Streptomyces sp. NPDC102451 TaxID=3366177 RepID=UPI00381A64F5
MPPTPRTPQPVTPDPPHPAMKPLMTQSWLDLAFLHWAADPRDVAPLLPAGTVPDTLDGVTYIGLVAFRMHRVGWLRLPGIPYLGTFPETNVRLYTRDDHLWSRMEIRREADTLTYTTRRRVPGPRGAHSRIVLRTGGRIEEPSELEHFLTARWGMHSTFHGRPMYLPNAHPRWPLHRAQLLECDDSLVTAAGLPAPAGEPVSVLYSPGVRVRFGRPARP